MIKTPTRIGSVIKNKKSADRLIAEIGEKQGSINKFCSNAGIAKRTFYRLIRSQGLMTTNTINKVCTTLRVHSDDFFKPQVSSNDKK